MSEEKAPTQAEVVEAMSVVRRQAQRWRTAGADKNSGEFNRRDLVVSELELLLMEIAGLSSLISPVHDEPITYSSATSRNRD